MDTKHFKVEIEWRTSQTPDGSMEECVGVAKAGRGGIVIARCTHQVNLDSQDFLDVYGENGRRAIEEAVRNGCEQAALVYPELKHP